MKVDFSSTFKEIQQILKPSPSFKKVLPEFQDTLKTLMEPRAQPVENNKENAANQVVDNFRNDFQSSDAKAQMDFRALFSVELPKTESQQTLIGPSSVTENVESVKTPTIIDIKRVPAASAFSGLDTNQRISKVKQLVEGAGAKHGIDPALSMAVVSAESSFEPSAISKDGHFSKGLMQLLDETAERFSDSDKQGEFEPFDPEENVDVGVKYLRHLHNIFSVNSNINDSSNTYAAANSSSLEKLAVAAYNAGEGRVASAQARALKAGLDPREFSTIEEYLPQTTKDYVNKVMLAKERYQDLFRG